MAIVYTIFKKGGNRGISLLDSIYKTLTAAILSSFELYTVDMMGN